jgi:hypothetical protein
MCPGAPSGTDPNVNFLDPLGALFPLLYMWSILFYLYFPVSFILLLLLCSTYYKTYPSVTHLMSTYPIIPIM